MRDRAAVRTFAPRAFDVDVDPLAVARAFGELVDPLLVDDDPVGDADFASRELLERRHR